MIRSPYRSTRNRRKLAPHQQPQGASITAVVSLSTDVPKQMQVVCNQPVVVTGLPKGLVSLGVAPTAVTVVNQTTFKLAFAAAPATAGAWSILANEESVRGLSGGRLAAAGGTF